MEIINSIELADLVTGIITDKVITLSLKIFDIFLALKIRIQGCKINPMEHKIIRRILNL